MVTISRPSNIFYSIRWRFAIIYLLLVAIVFGIISVAVSELLKDYLISQRVENVRKDVYGVSVQTAPYLVQSDANELYNIVGQGVKDLGGRMLVLSSSGIVQTDSFSEYNGVRLESNEVNDIIFGKNSSSYGFHRISDDSSADGFFWALYSAAAISNNGTPVGVLLHSVSIQDAVEQIQRLRMQMLMMYLFACVVVIVVSMIITRLVTQPVQKLTDTALRISSGDLGSRTHIKGKTELAELGQTFNMMCDRLQNIDRQRSEFVSDASHELKTPLASMKILVESLLYQDNVDETIYKEFLSDINGEIDRLSDLITDLLLISKMDGDSMMINAEKIPLSDVVEKSVETLRPLAEKRGIEIRYRATDPMMIECDPLKLRQAINNLVDNAIKYTRSSGHVDATTRRNGQEAHVVIADDGVGMSEEHLAHIFERFYRVDKARSRGTGGTGLGLHIVRRIALMHGGRVEVTSREGSGSVFTLVLPVVQNKPEETDGA